MHASDLDLQTPNLSLLSYLNKEQVFFIKSPTRDGAINEMASYLQKQGRLSSPDSFSQAIFNREKLVSTGIGFGVAVPHARSSQCEDFFIAVGVSSPGIEWHAIDKQPVHLILMIGGPPNKQTQYLQLLSNLTLLIRNKSKRRALLQAKSTDDIMQIFEQMENSLEEELV